jgi:hypothetical protein
MGSVVVLMAVFLGGVAYATSQAPSSTSSTAAQLKQVAYLKASNPSEDAHFGCGGTLTGHAGNATSISDDGSTIAIGAPRSGARGQAARMTKSVYSAGAVCVFTRRANTAWPAGLHRRRGPWKAPTSVRASR